ncbi:ATP-binding protein [Kitasatospora sp. NPDC004240]
MPAPFSVRLERHRRMTSIARGFLRAYLAGLETGEQYADVGELLLGELFANAVRHAKSPADRLVELRFAVAGGQRLRIEVHDAGGGLPSLREVSEEDEGGRGLFLVNELAERWGCTARPGGIGKVVWALIAPAHGAQSEPQVGYGAAHAVIMA